MRNFRSLIIGGLIGAALFLVFNCAGYVLVALVGSRIVNPDDQRPDVSAADPPADAVTFVRREIVHRPPARLITEH